MTGVRKHWLSSSVPVIALLAGGLLLLALFLPGPALATRLAGDNAARLPALQAGTVILRLALATTAGLLLVESYGRRWFDSPGLPPAVTGLLLGPERWVQQQERPRHRLLAGLVILAAALRLVALNRDLWLDEIATLVEYARLPFLETVTTFVSANQHPLYSAFSSLSLSLLGESAWAVRLPAVLFGVAGIPALYYFARVLTSEQEALWATALLAVSYHHVWFSQNARGWIGLLFFVLLGSGLFLRALAQNRRATWLAYAVVMVLGIFVHLNTLFVFLGHLAAYLFVLPRWPGWARQHWPLTRRLVWVSLLTGSLSIALYSFILPEMVVYYQTADRTGVGWANPLDLLAQVTVGLLAGFLLAGLLVLGPVMLAGLASYWRQSRLLIGLLIFPAGFNALALLALQVGAYPRAFLYLLPLGLVVAVRGAFVSIGWLAGRLAGAAGSWLRQYGGAALLGLLVVASLLSLIPYYRVPKQNYTGALAYVEERREPGDVVAAVGLAISSYRVLYAPNLAFPETAEELAALRGPDHATWVIYTFQRDMRIRYNDLYNAIERDFTLEAAFPGTVGDGTVWVVRSKDGPG
ncbi:MAG: glycosyltransferase family 39 protein [Chloroflexi bacterium]|nr:glycosyltransferase family 39 protein [Chloroflexota bacterium]MCI0579120.1 glycosyltransferase family 39 protein [Chloroflexota bacterium]MCI0643337.1 glycosyltransferase family 39 protein [Chloroflexota bacterium]MCI0728316.1 glycosyltransferase family 39 protein [Chloroflexota bacterium]